MYLRTATAISCPNIAFIKYWGDRDPCLRIPASNSLSMNLDGLFTRTRVAFDPVFPSDSLVLNGHSVTGAALGQVGALLGRARQMAGKAQVYKTCWHSILSWMGRTKGAPIL